MSYGVNDQSSVPQTRLPCIHRLFPLFVQSQLLITKNRMSPNKLKYYFYDWLQSGYSKEQILRRLNDSEIKSLIIDDIMSEQQDLEIKKDNIITLYQKQLKEFKIQHKDDAEPLNHQEKSTKLALPWKILLFNKVIKTILKGL